MRPPPRKLFSPRFEVCVAFVARQKFHHGCIDRGQSVHTRQRPREGARRDRRWKTRLRRTPPYLRAAGCLPARTAEKLERSVAVRRRSVRCRRICGRWVVMKEFGVS